MYIRIEPRVEDVIGSYYNVVLVREGDSTGLGFYSNEHQAFAAAIMAGRMSKILGHGTIQVVWEKS